MGRAHLGSTAAAALFTVPAAVFVTAVWALHWLPHHILGWHNALAPMFAVAILLSTFTAQAVLVTGLLMAALVFAGILAVREPGPTARPPALAEDQLAR